MTPTPNAGRNARARAASPLRSITATALLASALLGAGAAQAGVVLGAATGFIAADTSDTEAESESLTAVDGVISRSVQSQRFTDTGDAPLARASLDSFSATTHWTAAGAAELVQMADGVGALAQTSHLVLFTLTSRHQISGLVSLLTVGTPDELGTSFSIDLLGPDFHSILSATEPSSDIDVSLTLDPGDYRVIARASAAGFTANHSGSASFGFDLTATDLGEPPLVVPEPQSLALVLAGLLGCGAAHQRRRSGASAVA